MEQVATCLVVTAAGASQRKGQVIMQPGAMQNIGKMPKLYARKIVLMMIVACNIRSARNTEITNRVTCVLRGEIITASD